MSIRAAIFDLYDTLVEIETIDYLKAKQAIAEQAGVNADDFVQAWKKYTKPSARGDIMTVEERIMITLADLGKFVSLDLATDLSKYEINLQQNRVHKLAGCDYTLSRIKKLGLKIGLVTNTSSVSKNVLANLGIDHFFDCTIYSFDVKILKPAIAIYEMAISKLNIRGNEAIFVGDGNDQELDGAKNAGMFTVKVGEGRDQLLKGKQSSSFDYKIAALPELIPIIDQLNSGERPS
jgi:putative hydrolase of the HAD superfamily